LPDLLASLTALSQKADALPLDELVASATQALDAADRLLASEAVAQVPAEINGALSELRANLATLREGEAMENANATLAGLRRVTDEIAAAQLAESLRATLTSVQSAVGNVDTAAAGLPQLLDSLTALVEEARGLPLNEMVASATRVLATADALIASEAVVEVPQAVNLALAELRLILADVREGEAVQNASASLASVRALTEEMAAAELAASLRTTLAAVEGAVTNVDTAAQDLPQLLANLTQLSEKASSLPLEELVASSRKVLDSADRLLASDGMAEVPPRLAGALDELRQVLAELREGGAVQNLNATLSSADEAAAAVAAAADALPALAAQLSAAALRAEQALASFGPGSDINRDTLMLLRELRDTAKSVNSLVVQLERRPNSVLFGR
jgi:paraquat-inducible protein B